MKRIVIAAALAAFALLPAASFSQGKQTKQEKKLIEWYDSGEWYSDTKAVPGPSVDKVTFAKHYAKYPERWKTVFDFISNNDMLALPLGRKDLSDDVFVNVQEYTTKEPGDARLEKHVKYIDVQCVLSGAELMGANKIAGYEVQIPFDEGRDIGFFRNKNLTPWYLATPGTFFIFFPDDIHATNIQFGEKVKVKKAVFKVKAE